MITHDIQRFSTHLAAIYANVAKPVLDVILYNYQLSQNVGAEGLVLLTVLVQASAALRQSSFIFWRCLLLKSACNEQSGLSRLPSDSTPLFLRSWRAICVIRTPG